MAVEVTIATGRRKTSVASIRLHPGTGTLLVNGRAFNDYFNSESIRNYVMQPLKTTNTASRFDIKAKLSGGGVVGQGGALRHAISRALLKADASLKEVLKNSGFLTRDSRIKERNKPGQPGARKRFQFSKR
ncbi:MAG: 30S ribosomal protein S9 [Lentisphaerae bacterium]|nr:30S ribosomal protein S9 [Lentisphaerota bacterium]